MRRPLKIESFNKIKQLGIPVESVVDIGILTGTGELMAAFKDKKHLLIEPIVEWNETIERNYTNAGVDFTLVNVAASNTDGTMNIETCTVIPGQAISHARLTDKTQGVNLRAVPVRKLDSILLEYPHPGPYLLKIDVDGVELQILEGSLETLTQVNVVVIEANVRNFIERAIFY